MSVTLPNEITYGFVADRILVALGDQSTDTDRYPDGIAAQGTVTFTAVQSVRRTETYPATIIKTKITCTIHQGSQEPGDPDPEKTGLLIDEAGHVGNVALITGFYDVTYALQNRSLPGFRIQVKETDTANNPQWLPRTAPLIPSPVERFVVNQQVYTETIAARDDAVAAAAAAEGILPGGTAQQALLKASDADRDVYWGTVSFEGGGGPNNGFGNISGFDSGDSLPASAPNRTVFFLYSAV